MVLALCEVLERKRVDAATFFMSAYIWRFGKQANLHDDLLAWKERLVVPDYVRLYLIHLQGEML